MSALGPGLGLGLGPGLDASAAHHEYGRSPSESICHAVRPLDESTPPVESACTFSSRLMRPIASSIRASSGSDASHHGCAAYGSSASAHGLLRSGGSTGAGGSDGAASGGPTQKADIFIHAPHAKSVGVHGGS